MVTDGKDRLGFLIHDAARLLRKRFEAKGSAYGLSAAQWRLLVRLVKEEGVAQARLAELLEIEPISVSRLLDRMEEGGLALAGLTESEKLTLVKGLNTIIGNLSDGEPPTADQTNTEKGLQHERRG